jgi:hypothetical protein
VTAAEPGSQAIGPDADRRVGDGVDAQRDEQREAAQGRVEPDDLLVEEQQEDVERAVLDALGSEPEAVRGLDETAEASGRRARCRVR